MAEIILIVSPVYLTPITNVHAVKISARKFYACNEKLETMFKCNRRAADGKEFTDFLKLVTLIAERATLENLPKKTFLEKV